jgi:UDP-3-O-[3-hydroxymyristoyl] glucosamine N-acyltransferase
MGAVVVTNDGVVIVSGSSYYTTTGLATVSILGDEVVTAGATVVEEGLTIGSVVDDPHIHTVNRIYQDGLALSHAIGMVQIWSDIIDDVPSESWVVVDTTDTDSWTEVATNDTQTWQEVA